MPAATATRPKTSEPQDRLQIPVAPYQAEFLMSDMPTVILQGGAGCGKTHSEALKVVQNSRQGGSRGMFVAASYPTLGQSFIPHFERVLKEQGLYESTRWNRNEGHLRFRNDCEMWLRSAENPELLLTADLAWAVGDEVGLWKRLSFDNLSGRFRQPGFRHQFAAGYTPKGRGHWSYAEFGSECDGVQLIRASAAENPFIEDDHVDRMRRAYGEGSNMWRQEVLGEFVAWEGLVYSTFDTERHVEDVPADAPALAWGTVVAAVDWGWTNPGVILIGCLDAEDVLWIVDEVYQRERDLDWWANEALRLQEKWRPRAWFCDPAEPGNIDALQRRRLHAIGANNRVIPGITAVRGRLDTDRLVIGSNCTNLIAELGMYCWATAPDGTPKGDTPDKTSPDHACDTARYLVQGLTVGGLRVRRQAA